MMTICELTPLMYMLTLLLLNTLKEDDDLVGGGGGYIHIYFLFIF